VQNLQKPCVNRTNHNKAGKIEARMRLIAVHKSLPGPEPEAPTSPTSRSAARNTDANDSPRLATPEQMANRKMKSPSPRLREKAAAPRKLFCSPETQDGFAAPSASTSTSATVLPSSEACGQ
jgi:hypothetical protein